ncbi:MAG TPA: ATP-grasp domain-containing protein [Patescibacteria group bacterium]|nr:ATP-grasp domain-containing protein [Patescibacteria group bacterium]
MKIDYDHNLKIAAVGIMPWSKLGIEKWFNSYKVASLYSWDLDKNKSPVENICLIKNGHRPTDILRLNTENLFKYKDFKNLLNTKLNDYYLFPYKPLKITDHNFLANKYEISRFFENKASFRIIFSKKFNVPPFKIYEKQNIPLNSTRLFRDLEAEKVILQDENLSGGKGTYIITNDDDLKTARNFFKNRNSNNIVASKYIEGHEFSIQAVVTKSGIFVGPIQRQIIDDPLLVNPHLNKEKFCGGVIDKEDQSGTLFIGLRDLTKKIGLQLKNRGYKGIFGVDFIVDDNEIFLIEINARLTGLTALINAIYEEVEDMPLSLLHILELGNFKYKIVDSKLDFNKSGSILVLHSLSDKNYILLDSPKSGVYSFKEGNLIYLSNKNLVLTNLNKDEFIIQKFAPNGMLIKPGGRILNLLFNKSVLDKKTNKLYNIDKLLTEVRNNVSLKKVAI